MAAPLFATLSDFKSSEFTEDDSGADLTDSVTLNMLRRASRVIGDLTKTAYYVTDPDTHLPEDERIRDALRDATCAQAAWFAITGNASGWQVAMPPVELGPLDLGKMRSGSGGSDAQDEAKTSRISPEAVQILKSADLMNQAVGYGITLGFWSA